MVMMFEPLRRAIRKARVTAGNDAKSVYLSPQGTRMDQSAVQAFASRCSMVLVCGRYEGLDERLIEAEIDEEWSIGDYVLSGGELAAMVLIDAVSRQLPGALGSEESAQEDSFMQGLLDCAHYTRPETIADRRVPEVLLNGNHELIRRWRLKQALGQTWLRRPDLLERKKLNEEESLLLEEFKAQLELKGQESS